MAGNDTDGSAPSDRSLSRLAQYPDDVILADWRSKVRQLAKARTLYASEYLRAKIRKESDGTAHQIATEATDSVVTTLEGEIDIIKAIWYARGRKSDA